MRRPVLTALVVLATAAPVPVHAAEAARIGKVFYEPQRQAIVVPFAGRPPDATYYRLSGTRHYWEFAGARLPDGLVQHHPIGGDLKRYTVAQRGPSVVRLAFELAIEARPALRFDAAEHRFEIYPFGQELHSAVPLVRVPRELPFPSPTPPPATPTPPPATPPPAPARPSSAPAKPSLAPAKRPMLLAQPKPEPDQPWQTAPILRVPRGMTLPLPSPRTALGRPEAGDGGLLMPFHGPAPDYKVRVFTANPRWLYFEFEQTGLSLAGKRFGVVEDPYIDAWMFTEPAPGKVRLYLRLRHTTPVVAQVFEAEGRIRFASPAAKGGLPPPAPAMPAPEPATAAPGIPAPAPSASGEVEVPGPLEPVPPRPPTEPDEELPEGAGPLLFPRPDSAE